MAKGLGTILVEVEIAREQARITNGESVACPVCGHAMEYSGVAWFCYSGKDNRGNDVSCVEADSSLRTWFHAHADQKTIWEGHKDDCFQNQTVAAIVNPANEAVFATLETVRGGSARTNLRIWPTMGVSDMDIPTLVEKYGWLFNDWAIGFKPHWK